MLAAFPWPRGCCVETAVSSCRDADFDIAQLLASVWGSHLGSESMAWSFNLSVALSLSAFGDMHQLLA